MDQSVRPEIPTLSEMVGCLTVDVDGCENDSVQSSNRREQQRSSQARAFQPFRPSSKDTSGYQNIVSSSRGSVFCCCAFSVFVLGRGKY